MHFRGVSVREIPFMLFLGLLFAVTVGWWVFPTLTVSVVFGNVAAAVFAVCSALSVTVGYGLVRHPIPVSSVFQTGQKGLLTCTRF